MTPKARLSIEWFERYTAQYRDAEGLLTPALELKYRHSRRVAENARLIALGLKLDESEIQLAEICGLVHDIGRFPQYSRFGSFRDADTLDHGLAGRMTLEAEGVPSLMNEDEWERVSCAVEYHNRKTDDLPADLPEKARRLLNIIRDADKLDIMDLVLQSVARDGFRDLPGMLPHIRTDRELTPSVVEEFQKHRSISTSHLGTVADFLLMLAFWFYDFNFFSSRQIAVSRDLIGRLQKELPDTPFILELFAGIRKITDSEETEISLPDLK